MQFGRADSLRILGLRWKFGVGFVFLCRMLVCRGSFEEDGRPLTRNGLLGLTINLARTGLDIGFSRRR